MPQLDTTTAPLPSQPAMRGRSSSPAMARCSPSAVTWQSTSGSSCLLTPRHRLDGLGRTRGIIQFWVVPVFCGLVACAPSFGETWASAAMLRGGRPRRFFTKYGLSNNRYLTVPSIGRLIRGDGGPWLISSRSRELSNKLFEWSRQPRRLRPRSLPDPQGREPAAHGLDEAAGRGVPRVAGGWCCPDHRGPKRLSPERGRSGDGSRRYADRAADAGGDWGPPMDR